MGSRKGRPNKLTQAVKDRIEQAFNHVNGKNNEGLIALAKEHPAIFYGMVAKLIPAAVAIDVKHTIVNLNDALVEANARAEQLENERRTLIDITPHNTRISRKSLKSKQ